VSLLAIDIGTTRSKVGLYDHDLRPVTVRSASTPGIAGEGSFDAGAILNVLEALVRDVVAAGGTGGRPRDEVVTAVGITSFLSHVMFDAAGEVVGSPLSWSFQPSEDALEACRRACAEEGYTPERPITGELLAPRLVHLARTDPDRARRIARVMCLKDVVRRMISAGGDGEDRWYTDFSLRDYSLIRDGRDNVIEPVATLLAREGYRNPESLLPPALPAHAPAGRLAEEYARRFGLEPGVPLAAGATDGTTAMYGGGLLGRDDCVVAVFGTTDVVMRAIPRTRQIGGDYTRLGLSRNAAMHPDCDVIGGSTASSGGVAAWMNGVVQGGDGWSSIPAGAEGVRVAPGFAGERAPWNRQGRNGVIAGLTPGHTGGHIQRALLEAQTFRVRLLLEGLLDMTSRDSQVLILGGGGNRTAELDRLRREILPWEIAWRDDGELSLAGAAMFARAATERDETTRNSALLDLSRRVASRTAAVEGAADDDVVVSEGAAAPAAPSAYLELYAQWVAWITKIYGGLR
jgi:xylulokinase